MALRDEARPIDLIDISRHGAVFLYAGEFEPGWELDLFLLGGELNRPALVRWFVR